MGSLRTNLLCKSCVLSVLPGPGYILPYFGQCTWKIRPMAQRLTKEAKHWTKINISKDAIYYRSLNNCNSNQTLIPYV
jgi:hypothetical protein